MDKRDHTNFEKDKTEIKNQMQYRLTKINNFNKNKRDAIRVLVAKSNKKCPFGMESKSISSNK